MSSSSRLKLNLSNPFAALKHKNFRLYLIGMTVSLIGTWMHNIAQPWLAYSLTNSPFLLSLVSALQFTPMLFFSLFAGVVIDRFPKKKILLLTQSLSLIITLILAILVWTGQARYWHILVMATALGVVNTLDMPARQAFVVELVGKEDLMNAIALNSTVFNLSRIIGPAIAGVIMAFAGVSACFFVNSISFAAVLISLFFIKPIVAQQVLKEGGKIMTEIKEGLRYIQRNKVLLNTLLVVAIVGTFAPNFGVLIPVFAKEVLNQQEAGYGFLMSIMGVGSLLGSIFIASLSRSGPKRSILYITPLIVGAFLILTGYTSNYMLTAFFLAVTGFFFVFFSSNANSSVQIDLEDEYRGRVMSVYTLIFAGSTPVGNLYAGVIADHMNARIGFIACGGIILVLMIPLLLKIKRTRKFMAKTDIEQPFVEDIYMNCQIRKWKIEDAPFLAEALNNRNVQDNLRDGLPFPYTVKDAEEYISAMLNADTDKTYSFAITVEEKVIGSIGVFRKDNIHSQTAELGYYIAEPYWGKGIGTSAVMQICEYVFGHSDIIRIFAEPFSDNIASCRVLEKAGFVCEGVLRKNAVKNGQIVDMKLYALVKEDNDLGVSL